MNTSYYSNSELKNSISKNCSPVKSCTTATPESQQLNRYAKWIIILATNKICLKTKRTRQEKPMEFHQSILKYYEVT